ncbi:MAG: cation:dicarboxylase symporter family transporter, partial [Oscillospiraceae bacterium]|nr:cation:dicarboxylase symporter family transporter [Oscillospiraceae bacterium]
MAPVEATRPQMTEKLLTEVQRAKQSRENPRSVTACSSRSRVPEPFSRTTMSWRKTSSRSTTRPAKGWFWAQTPTKPVTLAQTRKMGVSEQVSGFVIPLCATIHMSGSMLKIVA